MQLSPSRKAPGQRSPHSLPPRARFTALKTAPPKSMSTPTATRPIYRARRLQVASTLATIAVPTHATQKICTHMFSCMRRPSFEVRLCHYFDRSRGHPTCEEPDVVRSWVFRTEPRAARWSRSAVSGGVGCCMIMIGVRGMVGCGWNRDHRALGVAEAVVAHGTGDDPADADMLLCADDQECRSDGFGDQGGPRIAREELELPAGFGLDGVEDSRDCLAVNGIDL